MTNRELPPAIIALNEAFDRKRAAHGLKNDEALGKHLGVSRKTISHIRNGRLSIIVAAVVACLTGDQSILPPRPDA